MANRFGSPLFNNETADKCGRLFDGATTARGLTPQTVAAQVKDRSPKSRGWFARTSNLNSASEFRAHASAFTIGIELKSLILAQIERWRHALHMQVERQHGGNPGGEWRTGE